MTQHEFVMMNTPDELKKKHSGKLVFMSHCIYVLSVMTSPLPDGSTDHLQEMIGQLL